MDPFLVIREPNSALAGRAVHWATPLTAKLSGTIEMPGLDTSPQRNSRSTRKRHIILHKAAAAVVPRKGAVCVAYSGTV